MARFNLSNKFVVPKVKIVKNPNQKKKKPAIRLAPELTKIEKNTDHDKKFIDQEKEFIRDNKYNKTLFNSHINSYFNNGIIILTMFLVKFNSPKRTFLTVLPVI